MFLLQSTCCVECRGACGLIECHVCCVSFFFFFKQKTAYEMRISDWSSDVCSSDLDYAEVIFTQIRAHLGDRPLQALINNAAEQILGAADKLSREDWRTTLDVNLDRKSVV